MTAFRREDEHYMGMALAIGGRELGKTWPNPAVGAVIVSPEGYIIGRGWTQRGGRPHAEPMALAQAGLAARSATLYVTLEPCSHHGKTPPCSQAIVSAGISKVVSAIEDPDKRVAGRGHAMLRSAGIDVRTGVLEAQARRTHAGHLTRSAKGRPFVLLKIALSANEKIAHEDGSPACITGALANRHVHVLRARSDAIAAGIGTVLADNPLLNCRLAGMENRSPVRVIWDSNLRIPLTSQLVTTSSTVPLWVVSGATSNDRTAALKVLGVDILPMESATPISAQAVLKKLADRGITRLMVEGGRALAKSFLEEQVVDEIAIFQPSAPLAEDALPLFDIPFREKLAQYSFTQQENFSLGEDTYTLYGKG